MLVKEGGASWSLVMPVAPWRPVGRGDDAGAAGAGSLDWPHSGSSPHTFPGFSASRPHSLFPIAPSGPTMKLKRPMVLDKYKDIIDSFYQEQKK